jgi:hypothetical protein
MLSIKNMTQMSCNFTEQNKIRTIYCEERRNKMATQAIPPPPPTSGQNPLIFRKSPRDALYPRELNSDLEK